MKSPSFAALFPEDGFGFRLGLKRSDAAAFFARSAEASNVLAERRKWLTSSPNHYVVDDAASGAAWRDVAWLLGMEGECADALSLGAMVEPDLVLLRRDEVGVFRVRGGVVVFPTSWSLPEKAGLTLAETHGIVPGLNPAVGEMIDRFLDGLKPGAAAERSNWGLAATDALNLHPSRRAARLHADIGLEQVWLRVEHQLLVALPASGAILFGIRIALHPLAEVLADENARWGLHRALATMPEPMATYKGLSPALPSLLRWSA